jgi:hypothetical protein
MAARRVEVTRTGSVEVTRTGSSGGWAGPGAGPDATSCRVRRAPRHMRHVGRGHATCPHVGRAHGSWHVARSLATPAALSRPYTYHVPIQSRITSLPSHDPAQSRI